MKRLGVFVFYDKQGIVDDYVLYLLSGMKEVCSEIAAVCNGGVDERGHKKLSEFCTHIYCRENTGMDAGALKDFFVDLSSKEYWSSFDELVWFNDTCYGPLYPMRDVFSEMDRRGPYDFWGITLHAKSNAHWSGKSTEGIPEHLQSYFIVVRQKILTDERFLPFWQQMKVSNAFNPTVANYELALTQTFASWGYTYGAFCDTGARDANPDCVCNLTADAVYELVTQYRCPLIKRKDFIRSNEENLVHRYGEQVYRTMAFIRRNDLYDTAMIYQNLMRLYDQRLWRDNLFHIHILSSEMSEEGAVPPSLILAELDHEDAVTELAGSLTSLPENCTLKVVTRSESLLPLIQRRLPACEICILPDRPDGLAGMFAVPEPEDIEKYDYFCFLQEDWGDPPNGLHLTETSERWMQYGNLVDGPDYIRNVLRTFRENPVLGILESPSAVPEQTQYPSGKRPETFGIRFTCRTEDSPIVCQSSLWCRKEVVSAVLRSAGSCLLQMKKGDLENLIGAFALSAGFYSGEAAEEHRTACCLNNRRAVMESLTDVQSLKYLAAARLFREVAAVNAGKLPPEASQLTVFSCFRLMMSALRYRLEKTFRVPVPEKKRTAYFLGVRDVYHALCKAAKSRRGKKGV